MKYLPSTFYLSGFTEKEFQLQLNKNSHRLANTVLYLCIFFLFSFTVTSLLSEGFIDNFVINTLRIIMILLSAIFIFLNNKNNTEKLHKHFFCYAVLFCFLISYLFWSFSLTYNELKEGGPMLVIAVITSIPMLHLGHKAVLWFIICINLIGIQIFTPISISWTLYFLFTMIIVMGNIQYQLDILLRTQYRAELMETEKANTDKLTGVYNRRSFETKCNDLMTHLKPLQFIALAMIDIDYFKKYNDSYGHLEGDRVLVKVAEILSDCGADIVVRFGGEEFILVKILDTDQLNWLHDLPNRFSNNAIPHQSSSFGRITVSTGIALANEYNKQNISIKSLLTSADEAMYKAKKTGRNKVVSQKI
ncbi:GGDEF domain-containing protein [Colwellia sp. E2M01]|uniref:GGDEF domain-containing protein n=1 Tax=Colwellia sp. E2M01 TaxID=2841561 RepID=UPI001C094B46|nr:GGDEF domain-containing protein [Colwellia sp. E2M01]MBU2869495.1 GGDEF domain-containing protein [Colwellia sp. E2M01]